MPHVVAVVDTGRVSRNVAPTATPLTVLALDARDLDVHSFAGAHGEGFFVLVSNPFPSWGSHARERDRHTKPHANDGEPDTGEITIGVFSLRRRMESTHPFISIGRTEDNDIAIHDETMSRFHAFVRCGANGRWYLQDAKSKNGTTVDGVPVPRRGEGNAVELRPGARVMFGSVSVHFADARELMMMARLVA